MGFFSDLEETQAPVNKKGFFSDLPEEVSRKRSLLSAFPKGLIRGSKQLSQLHDPISSAISSFAKNKSDLEEELSQRFLSTQKGNFAENALETAGELAPSFAIGPGGIGAKAAQVAAGSLSKNVLKEMGAQELVQDIGAGVGSFIPQGVKGLVSKKIIPSKAQKEVYDFLKSYGATDKQIVPFIQNKSKISALSRFAKGGINKEKLASEGKPLTEAIYNSIDTKGSNLGPLEGFKKQAFVKLFNEELENLPYFYKDLLKKDIKYLNNSEMGWKDLRDVEKSINNRIKGVEGGKAQIGRLKEALFKGQSYISPELFKEKQLINKAFSSHKNLLKKLSKDTLDKLLGAGEIGAIAQSILSGNPLLLKGVLLKRGGELALSKFLTSPRFQGMQRKLLHSVKKNNEGAILNIVTKILQDVGKHTHEDSAQEE